MHMHKPEQEQINNTKTCPTHFSSRFLPPHSPEGMDESCRTYVWVKSHIWMNHVAHTNESRRTYEWVLSDTRINCDFLPPHSPEVNRGDPKHQQITNTKALVPRIVCHIFSHHTAQSLVNPPAFSDAQARLWALDLCCAVPSRDLACYYPLRILRWVRFCAPLRRHRPILYLFINLWIWSWCYSTICHSFQLAAVSFEHCK